RGLHLLARAVAELRGRALDGDGPDVCDREVVAREADRRALGHAASLVPGALTLDAVPRAPMGYEDPLLSRYASRAHVSVSRVCRLRDDRGGAVLNASPPGISAR